MTRITDVDHMTGERRVLLKHIEEGKNFETAVSMVTGKAPFPNKVEQSTLGVFRSPQSRKAVIADTTLHEAFAARKLKIPSFLEAGPRAELRYNPQKVRAAIVTCGGLAPGMHCVIHGIAKRHCSTYSMGDGGAMIGVYNSFRGLCNFADNHCELRVEETENWLAQGGSKLGSVRYYYPGGIAAMAKRITRNLVQNNIDILYVIGGDGSLKVARELAEHNPSRSIVGIPKTMDNDVLWVWQSFGFDTAVEQATGVINTLRDEARSTRRIGVIELFGAESGFVAANATLASGHVDLVLIPEVFQLLDKDTAVAYLNATVEHICNKVKRRPHEPHAIVVVAEGVATVLEDKKVVLDGRPVRKDTFAGQLKQLFEGLTEPHGDSMQAFVNQPRHYIRAVPANAHDQIYCERLGALAVDNALAGYTNFMISYWLTEFVLVPLHLVGSGKKSIPITGMFWKQVVASTGQPLSPPELAVDPAPDPGTSSGPTEGTSGRRRRRSKTSEASLARTGGSAGRRRT